MQQVCELLRLAADCWGDEFLVPVWQRTLLGERNYNHLRLLTPRSPEACLPTPRATLLNVCEDLALNCDALLLANDSTKQQKRNAIESSITDHTLIRGLTFSDQTLVSKCLPGTDT